MRPLAEAQGTQAVFTEGIDTGREGTRRADQERHICIGPRHAYQSTRSDYESPRVRTSIHMMTQTIAMNTR